MRPANDKTQSLRYLLLRHAWLIKPIIPASIYREVTSTLNVSITGKGFLVTWLNNGIQFEKKYGDGEFNFFIRGDINKKGNDYSIDYTTNNNLAESFVKIAFDLDEINISKRKESLLPINPVTLFSYIAFLAISWFYGGEYFLIFSTLLLLLFACEYWYPNGKLFVPLIILGFVQIQLVFTSLFGITIFFFNTVS